MSWTTLLLIAGGAYSFKAAGALGLGRLARAPSVLAVGTLLPPALLSGLIVLQTLTLERDLVLDARAPGVAVGALAAWRGAPFWLVAVLAAVVTTTIRTV